MILVYNSIAFFFHKLKTNNLKWRCQIIIFIMKIPVTRIKVLTGVLILLILMQRNQDTLILKEWTPKKKVINYTLLWEIFQLSASHHYLRLLLGSHFMPSRKPKLFVCGIFVLKILSIANLFGFKSISKDIFFWV